jgi:glutathione S-transferase
MLLIGVNRSPYTRRVAITLRAYNVAFDQQELTGFHNRQEVRTWNPLGRIPALVLNNSEALIDSAAIIDYLDEEIRWECPTDTKGRARAPQCSEDFSNDDGRLRQRLAGGLYTQSHSTGKTASAVD